VPTPDPTPDAWLRTWGRRISIATLALLISLVAGDLWVRRDSIIRSAWTYAVGGEPTKVEAAIDRAYRADGRSPSDGEIAYWAGEAAPDRGGMAVALPRLIDQLGVGGSPRDRLDFLYEVLFDRAPDVDAHDWLESLEAGADTGAVAVSMLAAPEWTDS
jgi:hypothetical protein